LKRLNETGLGNNNFLFPLKEIAKTFERRTGSSLREFLRIYKSMKRLSFSNQDQLSELQPSELQLSELQLSELQLSELQLTELELSELQLSELQLSELQLSELQVSELQLSE
jgi:hypothetical protein